MTKHYECAFPKHPETVDGLTKREYFAAMAMQGFAANRRRKKRYTKSEWDEYCIDISNDAMQCADYLIKFLNGEGVYNA